MAYKIEPFVAKDTIPESAPPVSAVGFQGWVRANLFDGWINSILTVLSVVFLAYMIPPLIEWAVINGVWNANSLTECRELSNGQGACWAVIKERVWQFLFGFYPSELYWRPTLAFILLFVALAPILFVELPRKLLIFSAIYPFIAIALIMGFVPIPYFSFVKFGPALYYIPVLEEIGSNQLGGFLLSLIIGVTGIIASLPLGILLALGRQSGMPFIQMICVGFIEFIRGVPLITLLFVASTLLNYFLPPGQTFDLVLRVVIMVTLFSAAYMAEVVRGGLAALPRGQYEAADALGLDYWRSMYLIILPQALKISIPGIVNTFIGLFKDTTLVVVIGMLDPLGILGAARADQRWNGIVWELYGFVALLFFLFCYGMSRYSLYLEKKLETGHR